jgi:serine beta-lactamase-like protein LACTB
MTVVSLAVAARAAEKPSNADKPLNLDVAQQQYAKIVATELARKILPGVSVAWVVDGQIVHVAGYGLADLEKGGAATADTIYRAGSISKLFNAVAAMQLVEQGKLDLDAPLQAALPDFQIVVPFEGHPPITARQLLCHRSGMIREAPVGGYLDASQPSIAATVASVAPCVLVNPPNTKTRYSNVGPTLVGRAVEVISGLPYPEYQQRHVLGPLGMTSSVWLMNDALRPRLAKGQMRVARRGFYVFETAPEFELGTIPAGNLYTTAADLARFAVFVMGGDASAPSKPPIQRETLEKMFQPQLVQDSTGFGLGFSVGKYREHKTVQHGGAVYGFSTSLVVLPEEKIGVIVLSNADIAGGPVKRLSDAALDLLLEAVRGERPVEPPKPIELSPEELAEFAGDYDSTSYWAHIDKAIGGTLHATLSGQPIELTPIEPLKFLADGRIMNRSPVEFERAADGKIVAFKAAGQRFERFDPTQGRQPGQGFAFPDSPWWNLVGRYGEPFIPLVISERNGQLWATVENEYDYKLTPVSRLVYNLPPGMYADEQIVFQLDNAGKVLGLVMANQPLPRRPD